MSDKKPSNPSDTPVDEVEALSASEAGGVVDAIDRHRTKILFAILGGAIVFCAILVGGQLKKQKHLEASEAYTSAATKGEIAALDGVVVAHAGSIPAGNALLSKAEIQIRQGKSEDAAKTIETFIPDYPDHPRKPQGYFALANLLHNSGDAEGAKTNYEKTIEVQEDGELTPLARIRLGDLALEGGDKELADQHYQDSYTIHPGNPFVEYAQDKIALLKIGNPPVVERPQPEPEPEEEKPEAEKSADAKPADSEPATEKAKPAEEKKAPAKATQGKGKGKGKGKVGNKAKASPKGAKGKGNGKANKGGKATTPPAKPGTAQKAAPKPAPKPEPAPAKPKAAPKANSGPKSAPEKPAAE